MTDKPTLVVGTAGHIDHGKSRLVLSLTGVDPDRLPEEKARGLTIDLGFAHLQTDECVISFVDVPGHERFIRNMVAGATGVDVTLLVVAADDSVMPQTREHAEVLAWLGIKRVVLVLTKSDLVDDELAELVEDDARNLLASLEIEPLACIRTSAETGAGIDELRASLIRLASAPSPPALPYKWFRMPVDRSFTVAGRGTVATGSVLHGSVARDEELDLWPDNRRVRVRDLQAHYDKLANASGRMRLALNLAAVSVEDAARGHELATAGYLMPTQYLDAWLPALRMPGKRKSHTLRLRLHLGTNDLLAELRLLETPTSDLVRAQFAQLRVSSPVVATWGQHFILRDEAATRTLGGGRVLRPWARRWSTRRPARVDALVALRDGSPRARLEEALRRSVWQPFTDAQLSSLVGLADADEAARLVRGLLDKQRVVAFEAGGVRLLMHMEVLAELGEALTARLNDYLSANPRVPGIPRSEWVGWMPRVCPERHRAALAEWLIERGCAVRTGERIVPRGHQDALTPEDETLLGALLDEIVAGAFQPPVEAELKCRTPKNAQRVHELIDWALSRGRLVRVSDGMYLEASRWNELVRLVTDALRVRGPLTVADIRTLLNSSRKYVVPIAEKLDALGITRRQGDQRVLGPKAPE